jgi:predicted MFS family arabinose efflux permease
VAIGFALSNTAMNSTISNTATRDEQGKIMGINSSIQSLSNSIIQVFAGIIAASLTYTFPLFASFVFIFVAWILVYIFLNKK